MACVHRGVVQALHASEGTLTELFNVRVPVDRVRGTGHYLQPAGSLARFTILQVQLRPRVSRVPMSYGFQHCRIWRHR